MPDNVFRCAQGDQNIINNGVGGLLSDTITGRYHELSRKVYDYTDMPGNPKWCTEEDIFMVCNRHRTD